jgi:small subunit ribosomal protein S16
MVRLRLRRIGLKGQPTYRIVAAEKEAPRDGRFLEILGIYNPRTNPATIKLQEDRIYHWMKNGAQPSESVMQIFKTAGTLERFDRFKKGEAVETLVKEAQEAEVKRGAPLRTSNS